MIKTRLSGDVVSITGAITLCAALGCSEARANPTVVGKVVDIPARPAYVKPFNSIESPANVGQLLRDKSLLRTQTPGRMQILLGTGRSFRVGGNTLIRLVGKSLELEKGQVIGWVHPGQKQKEPFKIRTKVGTASIVGTTVYIDSKEDSILFFSWEGFVRIQTSDGNMFTLRSGERLLCHLGLDSNPLSYRCEAPSKLSRTKLNRLIAEVTLLHGFSRPMHTMPIMQRELGY